MVVSYIRYKNCLYCVGVKALYLFKKSREWETLPQVFYI